MTDAVPFPTVHPTASPYLRVEQDGPVLTVTLDRPDQLNAQLPSMWDALREVGDALPDEVRVVVVRGEGRAFSAGLDRRLFGAEPVPGEPGLLTDPGLDPERAAAQIAAWQGAFSWLRRPGVVSVAAVQGYALGGGFQLALACDLRVLAEDAQLAMPETGLGIVPDLGGTLPLVAHVGYSRALELCVTGRRMGAQEAYAAGLATLVVPSEQLATATADLVSALLAPLPGAVRSTKAVLLAALHATAEEQLATERETQVGRLAELRAAVGTAE